MSNDRRSKGTRSGSQAINYQRYESGRDSGWSTEDAAKEMVKDGVDDITAIRLIRELYGTDLISAKEAWIRAKHQIPSLVEHQENLLDPLKDVLEPEKSNKQSKRE